MEALYLILILPVLLLACRMIVIQIMRKKKSAKSISKSPVFQDLMEIQELIAVEDTINRQVQGGYGSSGFEPTNPIPVDGVFGEISYLGRLMTVEGVRVEYSRLGSVVVNNLDNPVDEYEIRINGIVACRFYLYPYCKEMSGKAPEGITYWSRKERIVSV